MSIVSSKIKSLKKRRFDEIKKRKTFLPTLLIALLLWAVFILIILFVNPEGSGALQIFFGVFFGASAISLSLLLVNTRRGVAIATGITFFLFLRYIGVGNIINLLLIIGAIVAFEFYFSNKG